MIKAYYKGDTDSPFFGAFRSEGYMANAKIPYRKPEDVIMENLPPLLRTFLVTDGTVTKALEAYFWEPVKVDVEKLENLQAQGPIRWLDIEKDEPVLTRSVRLRGEHTNKIYATAFSVVKLSNLQDDIREALISGKIGIGVLIRDSGLESYREIVDIEADKHQGQLNAEEDAKLIDTVSRTYRIIVNHKPAILITEAFPLEHYKT